MRRRAGFTFVEMLLVMAIIAVIVAVAFPRFQPNQQQANLRRGAQQLQNDLQYLRQLAETDGTPQTISFFNDSQYALNPATPLNPTGDDIRSLPLKVRFLSVNGNPVPPAATAVFDLDEEGRMLASELEVVLSLEGGAAERPEANITVNKNTGLTEVTYP